MRILHFSDIHLPVRLRRVRLVDWLGKRALGGLNLLRGRAKRFAEGHEKLAALDRLRREQDVDFVVFSGDYTNLGTRRELTDARAAVTPLTEAPAGFAQVPGNHDLYVPEVVRRGWWSEVFGDLERTDLPAYRVSDEPWPFVRLLDEGVAIVGVNSARPNPPWLSSGAVPEPQLDALRRLLADDALSDRFIFVVSHYAPRLEDGARDTPHHGLDNADAYLAACAAIERGAILCGHVHRRYTVRADGVRAPIFCAGSATMQAAEGLWLFDVDAKGARATPGAWRDGGYVLEPEHAVSM
ncbi:MAG: metallophosphoesterase [Planctomycetota bacterium]